jgi:hypothetical protein
MFKVEQENKGSQMSVIREEPPKFPHRFTKVQKNNVWSMGGATAAGYVTYGHCVDCGKQYLGPHDLYTECRVRESRQK